MKVLHITTTDRGGAGFCCIMIHKSLLKIGVESKVLVEFKTKSEAGVLAYGSIIERIHRIPSKILRRFGLVLTERNKITALEKKYKVAFTRPVSPVDLSCHELIKWADVIHLHFVNNYVDYPSFFNKVKKPIVWTLHDENLFYGISHYHRYVLGNNPLEIKYQKVKNSAIRNAHNLTIVFLSQMMYHNFGSNEIIANRDKIVINNPVDSLVYLPQNRQELRKKYGLDPQKVYFAFISMNIADPRKGLDLLSEALKIVQPEAEILAVGENPWHKSWQNVKEMGYVPDKQKMCEIINIANYFAMPSFHEAFSLSPLEAMSCGIPVIAFPVSGTSDLINNENGIICNDFTKDSLVAGIQEIMKRNFNPDTIRQYILKYFSLEAIANRYLDLYRGLVQ